MKEPFDWPHSICRKCWDKLNPAKDPVLCFPNPTEICCFCGGKAGDGIYTKQEPTKIKCKCSRIP